MGKYIPQFTDTQQGRMKELFGIASTRILSESEEKELETLTEAWQLAYTNYLEKTATPLLRQWHKVAKGTAEAIKAVTQKYYADCYNTERDMHRLMLWEAKLRELLGESYEKHG